MSKAIGKRQLRELIEDAWYDAPTALAGFGRIEVIADQYAKQVANEARIDELKRIPPETIVSGQLQPITASFRIAELERERKMTTREVIEQAERVTLAHVYDDGTALYDILVGVKAYTVRVAIEDFEELTR